ncbi:helix-turn-helix domain-containing protein [Zhouia spongiae]|uniref:Helix-turn-helix domain-containing protein n=1 Tax=Zhouia spongiae TaxID=2202721 RepID=A0ABY3YLU6_9FLAO|nr:helix-turn-helix domain-containing protein [Zhouia spongiae]UNY98765.1 helix-turn-helix domain-containing protein [Zhouia spongiae]
MKKNKDITSFDVYDYLNYTFFKDSKLPYLMVDSNIYKKASIDFPIRNTFYGIALTNPGNVRVKIACQNYTIKNNSLILLGPGIVSQWMTDSDAPTDTILFQETLLEKLVSPVFLSSLPFFQPGGHHVFELKNQEYKKIKTFFLLMSRFTKEPNILPGIVYSLLEYIKTLYYKHLINNQTTLNIKENQVLTFKSLVAKYFREQKQVSFYASKMNITPKYLSEFLLSETGKTAKNHIIDVVILDAKSLLKQTSLSVQEISFILGYTEPSYFSKIFKKIESISPLEYRRK